MSIDANDPRLTGYALGELDAAECALVEALLSTSSDARKIVEETKHSAQLLVQELEREATCGLSTEESASVKDAIGGHEESDVRAGTARRRWRRWIPVGIAASLLAGAITVSITVPTLSRARETAKRTTLASEQVASATSGDRQFEFHDIPRLSYGYQLPYQRGSEEGGSVLRFYRQATGNDGHTAFGDEGAGTLDRQQGGERAFSVLLGQDGRGNSQIGQAASDVWAINGVVPDSDGDGFHDLAVGSFGFGTPADFDTEAYARVVDNPFRAVMNSPLSTFSIDVDTASYANVRRFLGQGQLPPPDAVRIEEMINYFSYDYPQPASEEPFSVTVETATCPWMPEHRLMRVGLKGLEFEREQRPSCNLVFLLDVSGSMQPANKLPLLKQAMGMLVDELFDDDRVAIVVYAGASGLVLPSTTADNNETILHALDNLQAGGSTNGGAGIQLAYDLATENFIEGGVNRVVLATDGDFNVGITNEGDLTRLIEEKARSGVFLSVLGFGMGNYNDSTLEKLADKGNGNYAYIDTLREAQKVLVDQIGGTLVTIAKDVKIQIEFNPAAVAAYRLIGYANRLLAPQDFNDDAKDAGEIGAGHTVTALYEIVPAGVEIDLPGAQQAERPGVDPLKYQSETQLSDAAANGELLTVKLRYKEPDGDVSKLIERVVVDSGASFDETSRDFRFAAAVASFGMMLRSSPTIEGWTFDAVLELAAEAVGEDENGYRAEFLGLVEKAKALSPN